MKGQVLIIGIKKIHLTQKEAEGFYYVHKERPFFNDLCTFMSRNPVVVLALEKENAILSWRELMGATNPANAEAGTLRKEFGVSIEENTAQVLMRPRRLRSRSLTFSASWNFSS